MVRLQHKYRRDGIVSVGGAQYKLDLNGCVEVPEDAAAKLRQGSMWQPEGHWGGQKMPKPPKPEGELGARRPRTQEELREAAESFGIQSVEKKERKPKREAEPREKDIEEHREIKADESDSPAPSPVVAKSVVEDEVETEVIEVSADMKKAELVKIAKQLGLDVEGMNKYSILEMIEKSNQE